MGPGKGPGKGKVLSMIPTCCSWQGAGKAFGKVWSRCPPAHHQLCAIWASCGQKSKVEGANFSWTCWTRARVEAENPKSIAGMDGGSHEGCKTLMALL